MTECDFATKLFRHIVILCWAEEFEHNGSFVHRGRFATCFLVAFDEIVWLVTAGHVIKDIRRPKLPKYRIGNARVCDVNSRFAPIPFSLHDANEVWIYEKELRLDFAAICVPPLVVQGLLAGGARPLNDSGFMNPPADLLSPAMPQELYLVGFPEERQNVTVDGLELENVTFQPYLCELLPLELPSENSPVVQAKIFEEAVSGGPESVNTIRGMSGGPIFLLREIKAEQSQYWAIAVQGSWNPKQKIISAAPLGSFVDVTKRAILRSQHPNEEGTDAGK